MSITHNFITPGSKVTVVDDILPFLWPIERTGSPCDLTRLNVAKCPERRRSGSDYVHPMLVYLGGHVEHQSNALNKHLGKAIVCLIAEYAD